VYPEISHHKNDLSTMFNGYIIIDLYIWERVQGKGQGVAGFSKETPPFLLCKVCKNI
jgi:hypothetical protein